MKNFLLILLFFGFSNFANADTCKVVLCMYGKVVGQNGGNECRKAELEFFSINVFKKGIFRPDKTASLRRNLLEDCPAASPSDISKIIGKFGRVRG